MRDWFRVYRTKRGSQIIFNTLQRELAKPGVRPYVTYARVETFYPAPDANRDKHFVICFRTAEHGVLPTPAEEALTGLKRFATYRFDRAADEARIQRFVNGDALYCNFAETLRTQQRIEFNEPVWPLFEEEASSDPGEQAKSDYLLHLLSIAAAGSREQANYVLEALGIETPLPALRNLRLLGHLEFSQSGKRWTVVPPTLYQISLDAKPSWAIAGQRSPSMVAKLSSMGAQTKAQFAVNAPASMTLFPGQHTPSIGSDIEIEGVCFRYAGPASLLLARSLAPIERWAGALPSLDIEPQLFSLLLHDGVRWQGHDLVDRGGLYQLTDPVSGRRHYIAYYDFQASTWLQGEYYGLKFLADLRAGRLRETRYNAAEQSFAVFRSQRWPEIYERALVLASGMLPLAQGAWLIYRDVPRDLAEILTEKLQLTCE